MSPKAAQALAPQDPRRSRYRGCLLGVCIGDAFGAAGEFMTRTEILKAHPPNGIKDLLPRPGLPAGSYTDDGQMSVATARGVLDWRRVSGWTPGAVPDTAAQEALSTAKAPRAQVTRTCSRPFPAAHGRLADASPTRTGKARVAR